MASELPLRAWNEPVELIHPLFGDRILRGSCC